MILFNFPFVIISIWHYPEPNDLEGIPDEGLIEKFQSTKDNRIIMVLISRHYLSILSIHRRFLKDPMTTEDVANDLFITLCEKLPNVSIQKKFNHWLARLLRNKLIDRNRRLDLFDNYQKTLKEEVSKDSDKVENQIDEERILKEVATVVTPEEFMCIRKYYFEYKSYKEIAEEAGWPFKKVSNCIYRGIQKMRKNIDPEWFDHNKKYTVH